MTDAPVLRLENVKCGSLAGLGLSLPRGTSCKLVLASRDRRDDLLALLGGVAQPSGGHVWLFEHDLYALTPELRVPLYKNVGVVAEEGGLISNLKAWENILLPAWYHSGRDAAEAEKKVAAWLRELDPAREMPLWRAMMAKLPDQLSRLERRMIGLLRVFLSEPEIVIYDFPLSGLDRDGAGRAIAAAAHFHAARSDRVSIYLCTDESPYARITADMTMTID